MVETIKEAAIQHEGKVFTGRNHPTIGIAMVANGDCKRPYPCGDAQGFVTSTGRFVGREEAMRIALAAGQVVYGDTSGQKDTLYSEDINGGWERHKAALAATAAAEKNK